MEKLAVNVGPELFEFQSHNIQSDICGPALPCLCPGALSVGVVKIGNSSRGSCSDDLRIVWLFQSRVGPRYYSPAERIERPMQKAPAPKRVVSSVLSEDNRHETFNEIILVSLAHKRVPIIAPIADTPFMELRGRALRLPNAGDYSD